MRHTRLLAAMFSLIASGLLPLPLFAQGASGVVNLAGEWNLALDRDDAGLKAEWFKKDLSDSSIYSSPSALASASKSGGKIKLPGTLQEQGFGDEITTATVWMSGLHDKFWFMREDFKAYTQPGKVKVPFWLNPSRHYTGVAWYQRTIPIPESWKGRRAVVSFERVQWGGTVWLGDQLIGSSDTLGAPQFYDLGIVAPGNYRLSVRVDNRKLVNIRDDGHAITDSTQTNWNGLVGKLTMTSTPAVWIDDARVFTNINDKSVRIEATLGNASGKPGQGVLSAGGKEISVEWKEKGKTTATLNVSLPASTPLWDEFSPAVQHLALKLAGTAPGASDDDEMELDFGLFEIKAKDSRILFNNRLSFFRGVHEGCEFPLTGYPPTDVQSWRKVFTVCKAYGLNMMRFHSWCPPEAAFIAADTMGFYLQPEPSNWGQFQDPAMAPFLERETQAIVKAYGNHPSFVMLSSGNEGGGGWQGPVLEWVNRWVARDPRRMYTGTTGRPAPGLAGEKEYTIAAAMGGGSIRSAAAWHGRDFNANIQNSPVPVVGHENGQWCAYPTFENFADYTGSLKPSNYEIFQDSLVAHGMGDQAKDFTMASGKFQVLCYKEEIEELLRTSGMCGFQLLDLHDFPGQGTAVVGVLDTFWKSKGYVNGAQWQRFCAPVVPLARVSQWLYSTTETLTIPVDIANFSAAPMTGAKPYWRVVGDDGKEAASGQLPTLDIPVGNGIKLGTIAQTLSAFKAPAHYKIVVGLTGRQEIENDWDIWVYPVNVPVAIPAGITATRSLSEAQAKLAAGGKVLFFPQYAQLSWDSPPVDRIPVFWNSIMNPKWNRSLGMLIRKDHPALAAFPTDMNQDWQWEAIVRNARGINIQSLPTTLKPIVQPIDDWTRNFREALIFEARVGNGTLILCTADLDTNLDRRPSARQLLHSLLAYAASDKFKPEVEIKPEQLAGLFYDTGLMKKLGATVEGGDNSVIDGNPNTMWMVGGRGAGRAGGRGARGGARGGRGGLNEATTTGTIRVVPTPTPAPAPTPPPQGQGFPHEFTVAFPKPVPFNGVVLLNRQNERNRQGDIRGFEIQVSDDGQKWTSVAKGELKSMWEPQKLDFGKTVTSGRLRFRALSAFGPDTTSALAELAVAYNGPPLPESAAPTTPYGNSRGTTVEVQEALPLP